MMSSLCILAMLLGISSAALFTFSPQSGRSPFVIFNVDANRGSTGSLKTALNTIKNTRYAIKLLGQDAGIFVVPDDDSCDLLQTDFHGLDVETWAASGPSTDVTFNGTSLLVVEIQTTLDAATVRLNIDQALLECDGCFADFEIRGSKPRKFLLIGDLPLDLPDSLVNTTTADSCCDKVTTRRAVEFGNFHSKHFGGCLDLTQPQKTLSQSFHEPAKPAVAHSIHATSKPADGQSIHVLPTALPGQSIHVPHTGPSVHQPHAVGKAQLVPIAAPSNRYSVHDEVPHDVHFPGINPLDRGNPLGHGKFSNFDRKINFPNLQGKSGQFKTNFPSSFNFGPHSNQEPSFS